MSDKPGALDVVGQLLRADRIVFDRDQPSARLAQPHPDPDRAVAARAANLERALRAARRDHQPKEPAVLLGDREHALVLGLDVGEDLLDLRCLRRQQRTSDNDPDQHTRDQISIILNLD